MRLYFNAIFWMRLFTTKYLVILAFSFLYKFIIGIYFKLNRLFVLFNFNYLYFVVSILKYNSLFSLSSLLDIVVSDFLYNSSFRFEMFYSFWNVLLNYRITLKYFLGVNSTTISLISLFKASAWLEREAWDMFGIKFLLHKNLRRILTDYGFQGHPLRKDFPLIGFLELRFDYLYQSIVLEPSKYLKHFGCLNF